MEPKLNLEEKWERTLREYFGQNYHEKDVYVSTSQRRSRGRRRRVPPQFFHFRIHFPREAPVLVVGPQVVAKGNSHQTSGLRPKFIGLQPCPVSMMSQGYEYSRWAFCRLYKEGMTGFITQNC